MQLPVEIALVAAVAYLVYLFVLQTVTSRRNAINARKYRCKEPPIQRNRYPLGIDNLLRAIAADKAKLFPVDAIQRTIDVGAITYKYTLLGSTNYFTADEKNIQTILATNFNDWDLGPNRRGNFMPLLGNGIFTSDGVGWEHSRAMMRPQFARDQVSDLDLEERHVQNMLRALDAAIGKDNWTKCVDLQVLFFRLTLDSATEFLFGESVDSQLVLLPGYQCDKSVDGLHSSDFASAFDQGQMALATRARFASRYWLVWPKGFKESCRICHNFIDHFVRLALSNELREKELEKGKYGKKKYVFLEALAAETQDPVELRSQLLNILLAGRDTTASLLGWLFFCLVRDPTRYRKLRDIIMDAFGTYDHPKDITFAKIKACTYLQHCNNEALRLYPVVPINGRFANKDTVLPRGGGEDGKSPIFVPKNTAVDYSVHVLHHRKDIWGPDAEDFIPERWERRRVGWEFLPFNGGPRICIGQQFALTESSYVTIRLLQRFDQMENLETDPVVRHNLTLTNCSALGVKVRAHAA